MARKKKKLNRKLVITLFVILGLFVVGGTAGLIRYWDRVFPPDPQACALKAQKFLAEGDHKEAGRQYLIAAFNSRKDRPQQARYYVQAALVFLDGFENSTTLNETEKRQFLGSALDNVQKACNLDLEYVEPRQVRFDIFWNDGSPRGSANDIISAAGELIKVDPKNDKAYYVRGQMRGLLARQTNDDKDLNHAFDDINKAIELKSDEPPYWIAKVSLMEWTERFKGPGQGEIGFKEALEKLPDSAMLRVAYADYLVRNKRMDEAVGQVADTIQRQPEDAAGYSAMARIQLVQGNKDEAEKYLVKSIKLEPTNASGYESLSRIMEQGGEFEKAGKLLKAGADKVSEELAKTPAQKRTEIKKLKNSLASLQYLYVGNLLNFYEKTTDEAKRKEILDEASSMVKTLSQANIRAELLAKVEGQIAYYKNDYETAVNKLSQVYEAFGARDIQTSQILITLYQRMGLPGKAEGILNEFLNLPGQENNTTILLALARTKIGYRDFTSARELINRVLRIDPSNSQAVELSGELALAEGGSSGITRDISPRGIALVLERADKLWSEMSYAEAIALVEELHDSVPKDLTVIEKLVNMYLLANQKPKAVAVIDKAIKDFPDNEVLAFQRELVNATPEKRLEMQLANADKTQDEFERYIQKAQIYARYGKGDGARQMIDKAAELNPQHPVILQVQLQQALGDKKWDDARRIVSQMHDPESLNYKAMTAQIELASEQYDKALDILEPLRRTAPDSRVVLHLLGDVYLKQSQYDKAQEVYARLYSNNPGDIQALIRLAMIAQYQGQLDKNEQYVREAHRTPQGRGDAYIAQRYMEIQEVSPQTTDEELAKVIARREAMLKSDPNNLDNISRLAKIYEMRTLQLDKAEQVYRFAYENSGKNVNAARMLVFFYARTNNTAKADAVIQQGLKDASDKKSQVQWTILQGDYLSVFNEEQALNAYKKAVQIDATNPDGRKSLAQFYAKTFQWAQAAQEMGYYLAISPDDVLGKKLRIEYLINARQYDKADEGIKALLQSNPGDSESQFLKARMELAQGNSEAAIETLNRILEQHPDYVNALILRGRAYMIEGDLNNSRQNIERARQLTGSPQIELELADVYMRMNDDLNAENVLKTLVAENPQFKVARNQLIELYLRTGKWVNARDAIDKAKQLYADDPYYLMADARYYDGIGSVSGKIQSLEQAAALAPDSQSAVIQYLVALAQGKQSQRLIGEIGKYKDNTDWLPWLGALQARAVLDLDNAQQADDLFLKSLKSSSPGMTAFIVSQIREAYGMKRAIVKLSQWVQSTPDDFNLKAHLADLCSTAAADPQLSEAEKKTYSLNAAKIYEEILPQAPSETVKANIQNRLGRVYYSIEEYEKSEKAYLECLRVLDKDIGALNNLAYLYVDVFDKPQKAEPYAQKAYEMALNDPNVLDTYGWVLARMGKYEQAERIFQQSLDKKSLPATRYHLGWVYEKTSQLVKARKQYRLGQVLLSDKRDDPLYAKIEEAYARVGGK